MNKYPWSIYALATVMSVFSVMLFHNGFIIIFLSWLVYLYVYKRIRLLDIIISVIIFCFFLFYLPTNIQDNEEAQKLGIGKIETVYGRVSSNVHETNKLIQFQMDPKTRAGPYMVTYFKSGNEAVQDIVHLSYQARCQVTGMLEEPVGATNPSQFDYASYLYGQGISNQMIIDDIRSIHCERSLFWNGLTKIRLYLIATLRDKYDAAISPWIIALIFGNDDGIEEETIALFQRWGLSHILAISGLHVGIIVAMLYFLIIRSSLFTFEQAQWLIILILPIYAFIAGAAPSVLRSVGMIVLYLLLVKMKQKMHTIDVLSIIFMVLIIFHKHIIYHIGFQLSFAVTVGLVLSRKIFKQTSHRLFQLFQISFIAQMMILPLQIHYFFQFNPLSIVINVFIVPYFSMFVIPFMFIFMFIYWLPSSILFIMEGFFLYIHQFILQILALIDEYLYFPLTLGSFPMHYSIVYYIILCSFFIVYEQRNMKRQIILGVCLILLLVFMKIRPMLDENAIITMIDIGQGDAIVIELPHRKGVFMIDVGATVNVEEEQVSPKVYQQIIRPYLLGRGIDQLDAIFITHEHLDHMGSLQYMPNDFHVKEIIISTYYRDAFAESIAKIPIKRYKAGDKIVKQDTIFHVLSPNKDFKDANTNSLTLYVQVEGISLLWTGDVTEEAEKELLEDYPHLTVDILKVGHHGSNTSTHEDFIQTINPKIALIPVGKNNRYQHPHDEVIDRLKDENIRIFRTDMDGAITLQLRNKQLHFDKFLKRKKR